MNCSMEQNEPPPHLLNKELRHVEASKLNKLSTILDQDMGWKILLQELTRPNKAADDMNLDGARKNPFIWNLDAIHLIEQQIYCGKSPTWELLNHWAITGRRRPTIENLIIYLRRCNLKRAEDYVLKSILGVNNSPISSDEYYYIDKTFKFENLDDLVESIGRECSKYSFRSLYESTNGFCHKPYDPKDQSGTKIGEGRFSSVFRATTTTTTTTPTANTTTNHLDGHQRIVAAKLLKSDCNMKYIANEIKLMAKVKHDNILELLGIAFDKSPNDNFYSYICLIYQYMENGSLLDCLSLGLQTKNMKFLTCFNRVEIAVKVARGISYLHSFQDEPVVHRDIKTANILISNNLEPRIGDFTLVRQLETSLVGETQYSQNVIGTSVYMSPEAFRGDISKKLDVFSYGIVLFELLTGLRPFDDDSSEDLLTFITGRLSDIEEMAEEEGEEGRESSEKLLVSISERKNELLRDVLDKKAGEWDFSSAKSLFELAIKSSETNKKKRPEIESILPDLEKILLNCTQD